ncbi:divalent metal cation transporter [Campylobacter mucosalis]|uniref:cation diffusion facilitator family transporter n=1 Tax=Campylobacter mucosalis TaxID=202 RepID=UPI000551AD38|nr:cation diffusion facilitator family transporter [Campylobacter mucosalis]QKF62567.1 divalent metal cation transporter [Campylobacter mucosalis]
MQNHNHHSCNHLHNHSHDKNESTIRNSFIIITLFMILEIFGGIFTNSLALLSDAFHMLSDAVALALSLFALKFAKRGATLKKTFGFKRVEILVAFINALTLVVIAVFIIIKAIERFYNPPQVATTAMLLISLVGLLVNIVVAYYMHKDSDIKGNVNIRAAYLHVLGDMLGSFAAIVAAVLMMSFGFWWADSLASLVVAVLIIKGGFLLLKDTLNILMEGVPKGINVDEILCVLSKIEGVNFISDVHIWSINSKLHLASLCVGVDENLSVKEAILITQNVKTALLKFNIKHVNVELNSKECLGDVLCGLEFKH